MKWLLQSCCDGENWSTFDSSDDEAKLVARKREIDHNITAGIDIRVISEEEWHKELGLDKVDPFFKAIIDKWTENK